MLIELVLEDQQHDLVDSEPSKVPDRGGRGA